MWDYLTARKTIFSFSRHPEKMIFRINRTRIWSLLNYWERWYLFFPKIWSYPPDGKWKMIFLKKNNWKYDIFFKRSKKMVFSKNNSTGYDLSCTISEDGILSPKTWYFFFERKMIFLKKYTKIWYFLYIRTGVTNATPYPPCQKKSKMILSRINIPKGDWHSRLTP